MTFIQLIDFRTSRPDEVQEVMDRWERATEGERTARRVLVTNHHDEPDRYCELVFFDSYDAAMENSKLPATQEFAAEMAELTEGEMTYFDLDVAEDRGL